MMKNFVFFLVVLFVVYEVCSACTSDSDCQDGTYGVNGHCCGDNLCYNGYEDCPTVSVYTSGLSGGIIVAIVIAGIAGVALKIAFWVLCCRRWYYPRHVIVTTPYQQFGVATVTTTTNCNPPPPQSQGYVGPTFSSSQQQYGNPPRPPQQDIQPPAYTQHPPKHQM